MRQVSYTSEYCFRHRKPDGSVIKDETTMMYEMKETDNKGNWATYYSCPKCLMRIRVN